MCTKYWYRTLKLVYSCIQHIAIIICIVVTKSHGTPGHTWAGTLLGSTAITLQVQHNNTWGGVVVGWCEGGAVVVEHSRGTNSSAGGREREESAVANLLYAQGPRCGTWHTHTHTACSLTTAQADSRQVGGASHMMPFFVRRLTQCNAFTSLGDWRLPAIGLSGCPFRGYSQSIHTQLKRRPIRLHHIFGFKIPYG